MLELNQILSFFQQKYVDKDKFSNSDDDALASPPPCTDRYEKHNVISGDGDDNEGVDGNNSVDGNGGVDGDRCETENSTEEDEIFFGSLMNKYQLIKK